MSHTQVYLWPVMCAFFSGMGVTLCCVVFGFRLAHLYERQASGTATEPVPAPEPAPEPVHTRAPLIEPLTARFPDDVGPDYWLPQDEPLVPISERAARHARESAYGHSEF